MALSKIETIPTFNILLLGETGVGKSTFINAFVNYLTFESLVEAEQEDLSFLVATQFTVTDENYKPRIIKVGASKNENCQVGKSSTQSPTSYLFSLGNLHIRLIDTPGVGDTRGADQDTVNFDKLLCHIAEFKEIHAICILLKPNESRITVMFEYCIKQLLSRLEKSASENMVFLFTYSRGTNYRPGETLTSLANLFSSIEKAPPYVKICLEKKNMFCIDNEAFRFLIMLKNGVQFSESERISFIASWDQSFNECVRLLDYIASLKPHKVQNTVSVNEARRLIVHLSQPLADIAQLIQKNLSVLEKKKEELKYCNDDVQQLKDSLYLPVVSLEIDEIVQPRTVCTSAKCSQVYTVDGIQTYHHEKSCCDPCFLKYIPTASIGAPELIFCQSMLSRSGNLVETIYNGIKNFILSSTNQSEHIECTVCHCSYRYHKHIYYQSRLCTTKVADENKKSQLKTKEAAKLAVLQLISDIGSRCDEYKKEQEIINKSTAKFAHFLQNNAITPYNDAFEYYLEYTIDREKSNGIHTDKQKIQMYDSMLHSYREEKAALDRALEIAQRTDLSKNSLITANDVMLAVQELYSLPYCGSKIKEMFQKQASARRNEITTSESEVPVTTKKHSSLIRRLINRFI